MIIWKHPSAKGLLLMVSRVLVTLISTLVVTLFAILLICSQSFSDFLYSANHISFQVSCIFPTIIRIFFAITDTV